MGNYLEIFLHLTINFTRIKQRTEKKGRGDDRTSGGEGEKTGIQKKFKNHHEKYDVHFF